MQELFSQLGIDWHLLLAQGINFFLLLVVLRMFVYKPLMQLLHDRRARIEEGVIKADEADKRLHEVDAIGKAKIKEAEAQALSMLKKTETDAHALEVKLIAQVKAKEAQEMANMQSVLRAREEESRRAAEKEAKALVRSAIVKTVGLSPEMIDDALIAKAVAEAKQ